MSRPTMMAVDEAAGYLFYTDWLGGSRAQTIDPATDPYGRDAVRWSFNASIVRAPIAGSALTPIVTSGFVMQDKTYPPIYWTPEHKLQWPLGIDLDRVAQKVYWTDKYANKIQRCNYDGTNVEDVLPTAAETRAIAIDAVGGKMYFSDYDTTGSPAGFVVKQANLDGTGVSVLIGASAVIEDVMLDLGQRFLYYTSGGTTRNPGGIMRGGLDGRRRGKFGITSSSQEFSDTSDVVNVVILPEGSKGVGRRRAAVPHPKGISADWAAGQLYWAAAQGVSDRMSDQGLGGKVFRTSLCGALPTMHRRRESREPDGPMVMLTEVRGVYNAEPYPGDVLYLSSAVANDGAGAAASPTCSSFPTQPPLPDAMPGVASPSTSSPGTGTGPGAPSGSSNTPATAQGNPSPGSVTTTGAPAAAATTTFQATLQLPASFGPSTFSTTSYIAAVAAETGVDASNVAVTDIQFDVSVSYALASDVTAEQATTAIAKSNSVSEIAVAVTLSRRLGDADRALGAAATTTVSAVVTTSDAGTASTVRTKAADATALQTQLQALGVSSTVSVSQAPAAAVRLQTTVTSNTATAVAAPTPAALTSGVGNGVQVSVSNVVLADRASAPSSQTTGAVGVASKTCRMSPPLLPAVFVFPLWAVWAVL